MRPNPWILAGSLLLLLRVAGAEEVRYFEENGATWAEATRTVRRPVTETVTEERERTVYRRETKTEEREIERRVMIPKTEYRRELRWHGAWNPFIQPTLMEYFIPVTRWEERTEVVKQPVTRTELIPEKRTEQVQVTRRKFVEEPVTTRYLVRRAPRQPVDTGRYAWREVPEGDTSEAEAAPRTAKPKSAPPAKSAPAASTAKKAPRSNPQVAAKPRIQAGGKRLESDPPRRSTRYDWHSVEEDPLRR